MEKRIVEKLPRITRNKKRLEKKLNVEIENRGKEVSLTGKPEDEYIAGKVIEALDFGFPFSDALAIKEKNYVFEVLNIKDYTKKKDLERIRGRIIGKGGKTLGTLSNLTNCSLEIKDNKIGIIGDTENIKNALDALASLIRGTKQSNVYSYLERHKPEEVFDLGLKEGFE